jgi:hypothetical protein
MSSIGYTFAVLAVFALLSPGVPIVISWAHSSGAPGIWNIATLSTATLSFVWLIVIGWHPVLVSVLGGYYPERPFTVICANLLVMFACASFALLKSPRPYPPIVIACVMVALLWTSIAAIQSQVSK